MKWSVHRKKHAILVRDIVAGMLQKGINSVMVRRVGASPREQPGDNSPQDTHPTSHWDTWQDSKKARQQDSKTARQQEQERKALRIQLNARLVLVPNWESWLCQLSCNWVGDWLNLMQWSSTKQAESGSEHTPNHFRHYFLQI